MTLRDVAYLAGAGFLTLFLGLVIYHFVFSQIASTMLMTESINASSEAVAVLNQGQVIVNSYDKIAIAGFFAIFFTFLVTSCFTRSYPVLIPFYLIGGVGCVIVGMFSSNFWEDITAGSSFVSSLAYFPFANHVMLHLPVYVAVFFVMGLIIIFAKPSGGGGAYD